MKALIGLILILMAWTALATEFVPLEGGVTWTYEPREPVTGIRFHAMSGPLTWYGLSGFQRVEIDNGVPLATTHWAHDDQGRVVLQGVDWGSDAAGGTWFFDPAPVFVDHTLAPGESTISTLGLWQVTGMGYMWLGEHELEVTCHEVYTINLPDLGNAVAVEQSVSWIDAPANAPWTYGETDVRTYGQGWGLVTLASIPNPEVIWDLVDVDGLETTDVPGAMAAATMVAAPSPFNPSTVFKLELPVDSRARLEVYDVRGRLVDTILDRALSAGHHEIPWQPRSLASGVYVARLTAGEQRLTTRVTLLE